MLRKKYPVWTSNFVILGSPPFISKRSNPGEKNLPLSIKIAPEGEFWITWYTLEYFL